MMQNLTKRAITSIFLLAATAIWMFLGAMYLEPNFDKAQNVAAYLFMLINSILFVIALWEIINLKKKLNWSWWVKINIFIFALLFLWLPFGNESYVPFLFIKKWYKPWIGFIVLIVLILIFYILTLKKKNFVVNDFYFILAWIFYLVLTFKGINFLMLQSTDTYKFGWPTLLFVWIIVMSNDVGAYTGGSLFGKHLLVPKISPKKTWEGAICGLVISTVFSMVLITLFLQLTTYRPLPFYEGQMGIIPIYFFYFGFSIILGVISQLGDLLFSILKRQHGVKDFSRIFPGHGGLLDRLDSFSLVIIFTFLILTLLLANF